MLLAAGAVAAWAAVADDSWLAIAAARSSRCRCTLITPCRHTLDHHLLPPKGNSAGGGLSSPLLSGARSQSSLHLLLPSQRAQNS